MVYLNRFLQQGTEMKAQEMRLDVRYIDDTHLCFHINFINLTAATKHLEIACNKWSY